MGIGSNMNARSVGEGSCLSYCYESEIFTFSESKPIE